MTNVLYKIVYEFSFENIFSTLHCLSNKMSKNMLIRGGPLEKWWGGGGGGKRKKKFVQRLFNRENYKLCKGGPQIWKIKRFLIYINNGVRKNFLNLNVADIGAKNAF
jgi:hypothetical protein